MKYDCTKTVDFVHEQERLCQHNTCGSGKCPLYVVCKYTFEIYSDLCVVPIEDQIEIVQKWSDENPVIDLDEDEKE